MMFALWRILLPNDLRVVTGLSRRKSRVFATPMACFHGHHACPWHRSCSTEGALHSTFFQKVLICLIAAFFAACLIQWGKIFVEGADDALNAGYKKDAASLTSP
jgi:hypothetical protein